MNKCTRCGKERIVKSSHIEKLERSIVTHTVTICPDPQCQEIVEKGILAEENRRINMKNEHDRRVQKIASRRKTGSSKK